LPATTARWSAENGPSDDSGGTTVLLARDGKESKRHCGKSVCPIGPQARDEGATFCHICELALPEFECTSLNEAGAWCSEQNNSVGPLCNFWTVNQRLLDDEPTHAVGD
jgi:hypothetical protein